MRRKQIQINKSIIEDIAGAINDMIEACRDQAVLDKLKPLAKRAEELRASDSKKLVEIDEELFSCIRDLQDAIKKGNANTEQFLLEKINGLFDKHTKACSSSYLNLARTERRTRKPKDKQEFKARKKRMRKQAKNGDIEEFELYIRQLTDENAKVKERCRVIFERLKNSTDPMEATLLDSQLKSENGTLKRNDTGPSPRD